MPILMEEPTKYFAEIAAGKLIRYGAILKDAQTGQIVGHLKEAGQMGKILSQISVSPFTVIDAIGHTVNGIQIHNLQKSNDQILQTLQGLGLATNVAALSSIASLGVSVAGFAAVTTKLNKIDTKLDNIVDDVTAIKNAIKSIKEGWEAMSNAKLKRAAEQLIVAEQANSIKRRLELAKDALKDFTQLRHYYSDLLRTQNVFEDNNLDVSHLHELTARYTFTCLGVFQAAFMIGDLGSYRKLLEIINQEFSDLVTFSPKKIFQSRCDQLPALALDHDYHAHADSLVALSNYCSETAARIESHMVELEYLENNNLTVPEYLEALRAHETDIVLIPQRT